MGLKLKAKAEDLILIFLQRAPAITTSVAVTGSSLEETISAVEKSRHYQSGMNNLAPDNVDLPNRSGVAIG